jgi:hypothetical protein
MVSYDITDSSPSFYIINVGWRLGWLFGYHLLLRDSWPYGIIFSMCVAITVAMVKSLKGGGRRCLCNVNFVI